MSTTITIKVHRLRTKRVSIKRKVGQWWAIIKSELLNLRIELSFRLVQWPPIERTMSLAWVKLGGQLALTYEDIPDPSHGRVFREKFRSVYVAKGVWSLLTDLLLNRPSSMANHWVSLEYISGVSWPPTPEDIPDPSHGRVFREKFRSVYVVKGVWSLLTDLLLNRFPCSPPDLRKHSVGWWRHHKRKIRNWTFPCSDFGWSSYFRFSLFDMRICTR